jgi:hypothetical protein
MFHYSSPSLRGFHHGHHHLKESALLITIHQPEIPLLGDFTLQTINISSKDPINHQQKGLDPA